MKSLFRLKPYLRPQLTTILISLLLAIPLAALRVSPAPLIKYGVDNILVKKDAAKLLYFPVLIIGIFVLNFVVRFFHYYLIRVVIAHVNQKVKTDLYEHLLGLSADYFTSQSTGDLMSRVGADPQYIDSGINSFNSLVREPATFILLFGYALRLNWRLTLITLVIFPPLTWIFSSSGRNLKRYISRLTEENARLYSTLQESFTGIRIVKTFRLERYLRRKFRERSDAYTHYYLKIAAMEEVSHPLVELLIFGVVAAIFYYGGAQVLNNKMTAGDLLAFFTTFALMVNPIRTLNEVNLKLHQADAACARIFNVFDWKTHLYESPQPRSIRELKEGVALRDVSFAYPDAPAREVLRNISFEIPRGQTIALVGASGAGKSSLVSLLPRIFDVTGGSITIDGIDIRELATEDLRRMIAVVSQEVFLFNDTIEENIRCGRLGATSEEIYEASRKAHADEFIRLIPEGYAAVIGERGQKLSGGQRQRISIARAFLRASPILILDEATSALDSASERAVQSALEDLMKNRTTLIIAHRLSTIRNADRIFVMREGQIVETGRHDDLIQKDGEYARFYRQHEDLQA